MLERTLFINDRQNVASLSGLCLLAGAKEDATEIEAILSDFVSDHPADRPDTPTNVSYAVIVGLLAKGKR